MALFGWIAETDGPPAQWDLREYGWTLCQEASRCRSACDHLFVCDAVRLSHTQRIALASAEHMARRLIMIGVEEAGQRARLINLGCAEALPSNTDLHELQARAQQVNDRIAMLPRWRNLGALTLDLFHRDARRGARWLGLHPREFGLLWRLSDKPGERVTRRQLLRDVWRINHEPETNSVEVHISRLRSKLAGADCAGMVETVTDGGYRLAARAPYGLVPAWPNTTLRQAYLAQLGWTGVPAE